MRTEQTLHTYTKWKCSSGYLIRLIFHFVFIRSRRNVCLCGMSTTTREYIIFDIFYLNRFSVKFCTIIYTLDAHTHSAKYISLTFSIIVCLCVCVCVLFYSQKKPVRALKCHCADALIRQRSPNNDAVANANGPAGARTNCSQAIINGLENKCGVPGHHLCGLWIWCARFGDRKMHSHRSPVTLIRNVFEKKAHQLNQYSIIVFFFFLQFETIRS